MSLRSALVVLAVTAIFVASATIARADSSPVTIFDYTLQGTDNPLVWTWQMNSRPDVYFSYPNDYFDVFPVQGTFGSTFNYYEFLQFVQIPNGYSPDNIDDFSSFQGPQLFAGDVSAPTMLAGTFDLTSYRGRGQYDHFELTVVDTGIIATPEPSSLILVGSGIAGIASSFRRRRHIGY